MKKIATEKIPQNIADALKEIGENSALFYLFSNVTRHSDWGVYKNFNDSGTDIVLIRERNNKTKTQVQKIKIEVKTRQRLETTSDKDNSAQFTLTENEWKQSNFVIGIWLEHNFIFVIPIDKLSPTKNNGKTVYKFTATLTRATNELTPNSRQYLQNWDIIKAKMK